MLVADPGADIKPLSIVNIILKTDDEGPWANFLDSFGDGSAGVCKYIFGSYEFQGEEILVVGQLAPPVAALIPAAAVEAMHSIVATNGSGGSKMTMNDWTAFGLIQPFSRGAARPPINPEWRGELEEAA